MAVGCCVSLVFGALPLVEVSCRTRDSKTLYMFGHNECVLQKHHPLRLFLYEPMAHILKPLIDRGFFGHVHASGPSRLGRPR